MCNGRKQENFKNVKSFFVFFKNLTNYISRSKETEMIIRFLTFAAYAFSFFTLVGAGGLPTSNSGGTSSSSGSSSNSYSGGTSNSLPNPLTALELKNGLNMVQSLVYLSLIHI